MVKEGFKPISFSVRVDPIPLFRAPVKTFGIRGELLPEGSGGDLTQAARGAGTPAARQVGGGNCALRLWPPIICSCEVTCSWKLFES